jgi:hypothetical protein
MNQPPLLSSFCLLGIDRGSIPTARTKRPSAPNAFSRSPDQRPHTSSKLNSSLIIDQHTIQLCSNLLDLILLAIKATKEARHHKQEYCCCTERSRNNPGSTDSDVEKWSSAVDGRGLPQDTSSTLLDSQDSQYFNCLRQSCQPKTKQTLHEI